MGAQLTQGDLKRERNNHLLPPLEVRARTHTTRSLTHSLAHSHTHSLTHQTTHCSLNHALTHSLTHSLTTPSSQLAPHPSSWPPAGLTTWSGRMGSRGHGSAHRGTAPQQRGTQAALGWTERWWQSSAPKHDRLAARPLTRAARVHLPASRM